MHNLKHKQSFRTTLYSIRDHSDRGQSINLDRIKADIDSLDISEMLKAEIISKVISVSDV